MQGSNIVTNLPKNKGLPNSENQAQVKGIHVEKSENNTCTFRENWLVSVINFSPEKVRWQGKKLQFKKRESK
jgi:hypothetical protein